uniref:Putative trypsin-like serine protease n=1 Tax=Lutzomyia longipalpis TaxID=7200 RepID=A0A1B0CTA9_LUTLO
MKLFAFLTWVVLVWQANFRPGCEAQSRVMGGIPAQPGEFPHLVVLMSGRNTMICSGSIISENWVLTAAHCLALNIPTTTYILAGTTSYREGQKYQVQKRIIHEKYNPRLLTSDIALIRVAKPFQFSRLINKISVNPREFSSGEIAEIVGFGINDSGYSGVLYKVDVKVSHCLEQRPAYICTFSVDGGSCNGDSGGPLQHNNSIIGITSHGIDPCANGVTPDVFTRVSRYFQWIEQNTKY